MGDTREMGCRSGGWYADGVACPRLARRGEWGVCGVVDGYSVELHGALSLALFSKKKGNDSPEDAEADADAPKSEGKGKKKEPAGPLLPLPDKARVFFERAQTVHDSLNFEYAMTLWLQGLRQDPTDASAVERFYSSGCEFSTRAAKKKGPTKDQVKNFSGKSPVDKFLLALLQFGASPFEWNHGIKAIQFAAKIREAEPALDTREVGQGLARKVLGLAANDPRTKKDHFVQMMEAFRDVEAFDLATKSGEAAIARDPSDGPLETEVRNMSAQAAMKRAGLTGEGAGEAGGFRGNIKNTDKQRELEEEEQLVKSESTMDAVIERAMADYKERPQDLAAIKKLCKFLLERGTPEDEKLAYKVLQKGYADLETFELRKLAGDIQMRVGRRKLRAVKVKFDQEPSNGELQAKYESARRQILDSECKEFEARHEAYPTDLSIRFELGRRFFELERHEQAIEHFQAAKNAPGIADRVRILLAKSFTLIEWLDEAESTYREALDEHANLNDDVGLQLRYGLMEVLQRRGEENNDQSAAGEAFKLASGIAVQHINFRDIRERRKTLQELVKELRTTTG